MNNRMVSAIVGLIAILGVVFSFLQSRTVEQLNGELASSQATAVAQSTALVNQATAVVASVELEQTQAAESQSVALQNAAETAVAAQAAALEAASKIAATAQANALGEAANDSATAQAVALGAAANAAANAQASALNKAADSAATAQAGALGEAADNAATAQASALDDAANKAATAQARAVTTVQAQATATLAAVVASANDSATQAAGSFEGTRTALENQITDIAHQLATTQAAAPTEAVISAPPATSIAGNTPDGWKRYVGKGVAIQLPDTYTGMDFGSDPQAVARMLRSLGPDFESAALMIELNPDVFALILFDVKGISRGGATNLVIVAQPLGFAFELDALLDLTISQFPTGMRVAERSITQLGQYDAGRLVLSSNIGGIRARQLQYYLLIDNVLYVLNYTASPQDFDAQLELFERSASTFEVVDNQ